MRVFFGAKSYSVDKVEIFFLFHGQDNTLRNRTLSMRNRKKKKKSIALSKKTLYLALNKLDTHIMLTRVLVEKSRMSLTMCYSGTNYER